MSFLLTAQINSDGKCEWHNKFAAVAAFGKFKGKQITVQIDEHSDYRSYLQNNYYWGVVIPLVRNGYRDIGIELSADDTHEVLLEAFLREPIIDKKSGEIVGHKTGRSSKLNKRGMIEFIERVQRFAAETLHIVIPDPDPDYKSKRVKEAA